MEYPGFNSFASLAYDVYRLLQYRSPLTVDEIHRDFVKRGGPVAVQLDFRTQVPLEIAHATN